jgi:mono/diheme cytochrome c family protein
MKSSWSAAKPRRFAFGTLIAGVVLGALLVAVVGLLTAPVFLSHRGDWPFERVVAEAAKELAVPRSASDLKPPGPLNTRGLLNRGREAYTGSCATCHGATGDGHGFFGAGLYPEATDLRAHVTQEKTDGELFWIIKNGLSFGGMPAFGEQFNDEGIWAMVGYLRTFNPESGSTLQPLAIVAPTPEEIAFADPHSQDPAARGAAIFLSQGCQGCHGAKGVAPGDLTLYTERKSLSNVAELTKALREPANGMPKSNIGLKQQQDLEDLLAYTQTFPTRSKPSRG